MALWRDRWPNRRMQERFRHRPAESARDTYVRPQLAVRAQSPAPSAVSIRRAIVIPRWSDLSSALRGKLQRSAGRLMQWKRFDPAMLSLLPEATFAPLYHGLSDHFVSANGLPPAKKRSPVENRVLNTLGARIRDAASDAAAFSNALNQANGALEPGSLRRSGRETSVIRGAGAAIQFLPCDDIARQIETLRLRLLEPPCRERALFDAAAVLMLVTNAHPYRDGNGRLGRLLFNLCLRRSGLPDHSYVAVSEIANRSRGGYEIRLRQAEVLGEWEPYLAFMADLVDIQSTAQEGRE